MTTAAAEAALADRGVDSALFRGRKLSERTNGEKLDLFAAELIREHDRRRKRGDAPTVAIKPSTPPSPCSSESTRWPAILLPVQELRN